MLRTGILVLACGLVLGGCARTPESAARWKSAMDGLAEANKTPEPPPSTETECVSERKYDGKIKTVCKDKRQPVL